MKTDHFSRICLVAITGLLAAIALRPTLAPTGAYAARHYNYELVQVVDSTTTSVKDTLAKYTKDGWERMGGNRFTCPCTPPVPPARGLVSCCFASRSQCPPVRSRRYAFRAARGGLCRC